MAKGNIDQFIGIEIGGTKLQLVFSDGSGIITERKRYSIDPEKGATQIRAQIEEGLQQLLMQNNVRAIGVGFGGPVDWRSGAIQLSHQVGGWENFNLKTWLQQLTGLPVAIDNDANTAALAEAIHGFGSGYQHVFYITIGSGIGGGVIIDKKVFHGRVPGEVEIGHTRLDKSGITLEKKCSGWAVNERIRKHINDNPAGRLAELAKKHNGPESYLLEPALHEKNSEAIEIINDVADDLAFALSHVVHFFNPDIIILGGGLSLLGEHIRLPLVERLPRYVMEALLPLPPIKIAALSEDAVPIGAIELAKSAC
jgi:glucokinase